MGAFDDIYAKLETDPSYRRWFWSLSPIQRLKLMQNSLADERLQDMSPEEDAEAEARFKRNVHLTAVDLGVLPDDEEEDIGQTIAAIKGRAGLTESGSRYQACVRVGHTMMEGSVRSHTAAKAAEILGRIYGQDNLLGKPRRD